MIAASDGARLVGYARVSTQDQDLALQIDALLKYGVAKDLIFTDKASAQNTNAPDSMLASRSFETGMSCLSGGWIDSDARCGTS